MNIRNLSLVALVLVTGITTSSLYSHSDCCGCASHTTSTVRTEENVVASSKAPKTTPVINQEKTTTKKITTNKTTAKKAHKKDSQGPNCKH